ncbi:polyprenol monophosphomannose synthase [Mucilaginibacter antarcticus]|uniref:Polyprenol monophosphomannose synthase n=1 Tax=Mucilaginibacter antarcticus TaxID=1855725 RepID=A0ABW5XL03_9SPHI
MPDSLIIIPTYNEKENIERMIRKVFSLPFDFHILIVDDGSPDGTQIIVKSLMNVYPENLFLLAREGKQGLGTAYIAGFNWAIERQYDYIFEMDADFSHNPDDLIKLRDACVAGADVSVGSRYITGVNVVNWPMSRVLMSYFASVYVRFITGVDIQDFTAGFMCYSRKVLETIELKKVKFVGYAFQIEMKYTAVKHGFKVTEVPIIFTDRTAGASKMSKGIFKEAVLGVLTMRINSIFRKYPEG